MIKNITLSDVRRILRDLGMVITKRDGEFCVRIKNSPAGEGYFTNDLQDALDTGRDMAGRL